MKIEIDSLIDYILTKNKVWQIIFQMSNTYSKKEPGDILIDIVDDLEGNLIVYLLGTNRLEATLKAMKKWFKANREECIKLIGETHSVSNDVPERREKAIKIIDKLSKS